MEMLASGPALRAAYAAVRARSLELVAPLSDEDMVVQSVPEASPAKWHLAHTTWFFETFVLAPRLRDYVGVDPAYAVLFNSYYESVGPQHPRGRRGLLTRPSVQEVRRYRRHVDDAMEAVLPQCAEDAELAALIRLGLAHEEQHQELLLTDIKHLLSCNPTAPVYRQVQRRPPAPARPLQWVRGADGLVETGNDGSGFAFDNECPRHKVWLRPHALADRLVTNAEYRDFVGDGGYHRSDLWLSDGWELVRTQQWQRPLYWHEDRQHAFTLSGTRTLDDHAPVAHLSFYEADAYARWAGHRLPTEAEWEAAAANAPMRDGDGIEPHADGEAAGYRDAYGACWQWTASAYLPYPGFRPAAGSLGEYNGKFMANQMVLRGSSCATPAGHSRATYRNFFHPHSRWQFTGLRLAKDC